MILEVTLQVLAVLAGLVVLTWALIAVGLVARAAVALARAVVAPRRAGEAPIWPLGVLAVLAAIVVAHKLLTWLS